MSQPYSTFAECLARCASSSAVASLKVDQFFAPPFLSAALMRLVQTQQFAQSIGSSALEHAKTLATFNAASGVGQAANFGLTSLQRTERQLWLYFYLNQPKLRQVFSELEQRLRSYSIT